MAADLKDLVGLAAGEPGQVVLLRGSRLRIACRQRFLSDADRDAPAPGAVWRHRPGDPGSGRRRHRDGDPQCRPGTAAVARRRDQGLRRHGQAPDGGGARHSNRGRGGIAGSLYFGLVRRLWAPAKTPKDFIAKLNAAVVEILAEPSVHARLAELAQEVFAREQQTAGARRLPEIPRSPNGGRSSRRPPSRLSENVGCNRELVRAIFRRLIDRTKPAVWQHFLPTICNFRRLGKRWSPRRSEITSQAIPGSEEGMK